MTTKHFADDYGGDETLSGDNAAIAAWLAEAHGTPDLTLRIPDGYAGAWGEANGGLWHHTLNATVDARGASLPYIGLGSFAPMEFSSAYGARIEAMVIGDDRFTVKTPGDIAKFDVGYRVIITAKGLQNSGAPPNFHYFEWRLITAIEGLVCILDEPVYCPFDDTLPIVRHTSFPLDDYILGGPATVYAIYSSQQDHFETTNTLLGGTISNLSQSGSGDVFMVAGKLTQVFDVVCEGRGFAPSSGIKFYAQNCNIGTDAEGDKIISKVHLVDCTGKMTSQSTSIGDLVITGDRTQLYCQGSGRRTFIGPVEAPGYVSPLWLGPLGHGAAEVIQVHQDAVLSSIVRTLNRVNLSILTWDNGNYRIAKDAADLDLLAVHQNFIPGHQYGYAYYDGSLHQLAPNWTCTSLTEDVDDIIIGTDIGPGSEPAPTFWGNPANCIFSHTAAILTGPNSIGDYAAPNKPTYRSFMANN